MSVLACELYAVDNTSIVSSSLPVADYALWVAGAYALGTTVTHNSRNWEALTDDATEEPGTGIQWLDLGLVNRLRPFDAQTVTAATATETITYQLRLDNKMVNAIGFLRVVAQSIDITITDAIDGVVYQRTYEMVDIGVDDIYEFFFADYQSMERSVDIELPPYHGATIDIIINPSIDAGTASIGLIALAYQHEIGGLEWGYGVGIEDYSLVQRDPDFGTTTIIERDYADTASFPVVVDTTRIYQIKQQLAKLRAKPALYIGDASRLETVIFGKYDKLGMVAGNTVFANYKLDLQETI